MTFFFLSVLLTFLKFFLLTELFTPWNPFPLDSALLFLEFSFPFFSANCFFSFGPLFLLTLNSFLFDSFQDFFFPASPPTGFLTPGFGFLTALLTLTFLPSTSCWLSLKASWTLSSLLKFT